MDSRSSLAGRRSAPGSSARLHVVLVEQVFPGRRSRSARCATAPRQSALLRRMRDRRRWQDLTGSGSTGRPARVSASWIADSAASVGSLIFFGVFAMSVVASYYAGPEQRPDPDRATSALALRSLRNPLGQPAVTRRTDIPLPFGYPIGLAYQRKPLVKVSLIIVNGRRAWRRGPQQREMPGRSTRRRASAGPIAATRRPTEAQRRYLERGLTQAGGKLPLFDHNGREVSRKTIESCVAQGWATAWIPNPIRPDWLVCRLTEAGYRVLGGSEPPSQRDGNRPRVGRRS